MSLRELTPPAELRLACGHDVPHALGQRVFNHYDMEAGCIERLADRAEPDTSGALPDGAAWWVAFLSDAGGRKSLDGSRMCCLDCAVKRGWAS